MCFLITCFAMTIDFIQRLWTFLMTCCIGCTISILLFIVVMSGISFGYNYNISEYFRISQGTHKVVVVRRNMFSNKTADNKINIRPDSAREYTENSDDIKLDDSNLLRLTENEIPNSDALESEDQIKYENPLPTQDPWDIEMDAIINKYPSGSVDQMKAILNHIYLRKSKKRPNKTLRTGATTYIPRDISTIESTFAVYELKKFKSLHEHNPSSTDEDPNWRSEYLKITDVTQKESNESTFSVET